jgi:glycine/serine hydroxymethyltransferase
MIDKDIFALIEREKTRQFDNIELIASENYAILWD